MVDLYSYFWKNISDYSFAEIADTVASLYLSEDMPVETIEQITREAMNFPVPVVQLDQHTHILELFHGCLLYTSPSPRDRTRYRMPSSA